MTFQIVRIDPADRKQVNSILNTPELIYAHNPYWIPPLLIEMRRVFNQHKFSFYDHGALLSLLRSMETPLLAAWRSLITKHTLTLTMKRPLSFITLKALMIGQWRMDCLRLVFIGSDPAVWSEWLVPKVFQSWMVWGFWYKVLNSARPSAFHKTHRITSRL